MSEDKKKPTATDLFCLFNDYLAGALPPEKAKAVQDEIARPDSRIFAAIGALGRAVDEILGEDRSKTDVRSQVNEGPPPPSSFTSRHRRGRSEDGGPDRP